MDSRTRILAGDTLVMKGHAAGLLRAQEELGIVFGDRSDP